MNILSFNWHTPYLFLLAQLNHTFDVAPANKIELTDPKPWHEAMRPIPSNVRPINKEQALDRLKGNHYDLLLAHNVGDLVFTEQFSLPKMLVFHNKLSTEGKESDQLEEIGNYRKAVQTLLPGVYCVFISETKRHDWGLPGEIIMPGIDTSIYGGYTGTHARAIRVGNNIKVRDVMTGYSIQEAILRELPNIVLGDNPDIPDAQPSRNWEDLKKAYRENRLFLNTTIPKWEDGYNLAMLEAMATGMPVVSLANPVSPLKDGQNGFMARDVPILRQRVQELLEDASLAREIGAQGKKTVEALFPVEPFLEKWEKAIQRAHGWFPHPPKAYLISSGHHRDPSVF